MGKVLSTVGKVSRPGNRWTARRRLHTGDPKAIARHNRQVGEVLHAFNAAQASLFLVFWQLAARDDIHLALDLWEAQPSDLSQRKILEIQVRRRVKRKAIKNGLLWAIASMNELSERRNDAVHSDVYADIDRIRPGLGTKRTRAERLENMPLDSIWRDLRGDLSAIANYANDLHWDVSSDNAWPSTKRPRLRLARSKSVRHQDRARRAKRAKQQRQREASQD